MRKVVYFILTSVCWVLFSIPKKTCFHSSGRPLLLGIVFDTRVRACYHNKLLPLNTLRLQLYIGIVFDTQDGLLPLVWSPLVARYRFRYPSA